MTQGLQTLQTVVKYLPEEVRRVLQTNALPEFFNLLEARYHLNDEERTAISNEFMFVLIGLEDPEDLTKNVQRHGVILSNMPEIVVFLSKTFPNLFGNITQNEGETREEKIDDLLKEKLERGQSSGQGSISIDHTKPSINRPAGSHDPYREPPPNLPT